MRYFVDPGSRLSSSVFQRPSIHSSLPGLLLGMLAPIVPIPLTLFPNSKVYTCCPNYSPVHGLKSPWARVCKPRSLGTYRVITMIDTILESFANRCQWLQGDHSGSLARKTQPPNCLPTLSSQPPIHMLSFRVCLTFFFPSLANEPWCQANKDLTCIRKEQYILHKLRHDSRAV